MSNQRDDAKLRETGGNKETVMPQKSKEGSGCFMKKKKKETLVLRFTKRKNRSGYCI